MGFGGGGSGSFVLPNHTHTNVLANGGELEDLVSLVDGVTMQVWLDAELALKKPLISDVLRTTNFTTVSSTYVDITTFTKTMSNVTNGKALLIGVLQTYSSANNSPMWFQWLDNSVGKFFIAYHGVAINTLATQTLPCVTTTEGQICKMQCHSHGGATTTVLGTATEMSFIQALEVF